MKVEFGKKAKDSITGFEGVVVGHCCYISGCNQILLAPKSTGGLFRESQWFDEQRIIVLSGKKIVLNNGINPGCDLPANKK